jgi:acetyltransferase
VRDLDKPVLGAWLGALDRRDVQAALEQGGVVNFYTPENAVTAFSFLAAYRRNQATLLEAPALQPEPEPLDPERAERLRARLAETGRTTLAREEIEALLGAFGIAMAAGSKDLDAPDAHLFDLDVDVATDALFGPVVTLRRHASDEAGACMLPPLSRSLARDLIAAARMPRAAAPLARALDGDEALTRLLLRVSTLIGALPWLVELHLTHIRARGDSALVGAAHARADPSRRAQPGYRHMAIHPYPAELIEQVTLPAGARITVRPIRPEDAELEREFVEALSPESRYYRFFYQLHELSPAMLARFTQVDYDREMALVGVADVPHPHGHPIFVGVARYIANPDGRGAEFAVVVADDWQKRGVARALMVRLIASAAQRGFEHLEGTVLRANTRMLAFVTALGFTVRDDPEDAEQVVASLELR